MSVNAVFSPPRFIQMTKAHLTEKKRTYFWFFAMIAMIYFFILLLFTLDGGVSYRTEVQVFLYYIGLITTGYVFALRYFSNMARPESALIALMQPTSTLEKWLLASIMIIIVYPIIYTLLFLTMTYPISVMSLADHNDDLHYQLFIPLQHTVISKYTSFSVLEQLPAWIVYLAVCGYAVTTSLLFKKLPMIKSVALGFCIFLTFLILLISVGENKSAALLHWFNSDSLCIHCHLIAVSSICFWVIPPLLLWAAGFWALKERDIA